MPKLDCLVDGSLKKDKIMSELNLDKSKPTLVYAPTWRNSSLETNGIEIVEALGKMDINVLIKLHDHSYDLGLTNTDWKKELERLKTPNMRIIRNADSAPYLFVSDILLSDASSVANEYTVLDKPIIYFISPKIFERYGAGQDHKTWGTKAGTVVKTVEELNAAVKRSLENPGELSDVRQALANDLFYKPGTATQRAVEKIYELIDLKIP